MVEEASAADPYSVSVQDLVTLGDLFPTVVGTIPLDQLISDAPTLSWFAVAGFTSWSDISCMAMGEIMGWPSLGKQRVDGLIEDLVNAVPSPRFGSAQIGGPSAADQVLPTAPLGVLFPSIGAQAPVENFVTGTRVRNAIERRGITTWRQFASLTLEEIRRWSGIGYGSIESLLEDLGSYDPDRAASTSNRLGARFPTLDQSMPIERLTSDIRLFNALVAQNVAVWQDLANLSIRQIAEWPGIGPNSVKRLLADLGRAPLPEPPAVVGSKASGPGPSGREHLMIQMRHGGATLNAIGDEFGISRERVRQIIKKYGGPSPAEVKAKQDDLVREAREERRGEIDALVRPVLLAHGAMTIPELAVETGVTDSELAEFWPEDLTHLRIRAAGRADQTWDDEEIYAAIQEAALYEFPLTAKAYTELVRIGQVHGPSLARIHQRFGGWAAACDAAGVENGQTPRPSYNTRWTDEELLAYARDYFLDPHWPNSAHRFDAWKEQHASDAPSQQTLRNRFGSWSNLKRLALRPGELTND